MIDVFVWKGRDGWKAIALGLGMGATANTRSEALRQLRHCLRNEFDSWDRGLRIIGGPPKENEWLSN